jgi:leucyl aminopeptidase
VRAFAAGAFTGGIILFREIRLASAAGKAPRRAKDGWTACGVFAGETALPELLRALDRESGGDLARGLKNPGFKADAGEATRAGERHLLVGLGKKEDLTLKSLRIIGARLVRALDRLRARSVDLAIPLSIPSSVAKPLEAAQMLVEGLTLANWRVDAFDGSATKREKPLDPLQIRPHRLDWRDGVERGLALAESANYARRLAATPPNICNPQFIAQEARRLAREKGLKARVIDFGEAKRLNMGGLVSVGQASAHKPCLIILEHAPARKGRRTGTIALVGKTITYDTGGYSLKINNTMKGMKYDKSGGTAVLGAMHAIASLDLPVRVVALLPAAENMIAGDAYRPDDIIQMHNGVSVEVTNTDAEGRLVLADALAYASKAIKPDVIVDLATLTGGVVVALGSWCAGMFASDEDVKRRLLNAAERTGERLWELPLWTEHKDFMRAKHADIWNSGPKRDGHPIQGAAFLSYFVDEKIPWAHLDIAGVSDVESDTDLFVTGPTGFGVRLMAEFVAGYAR